MNCNCYDSFIRAGYLDDGCQVYSQFDISNSDGHDICIVSTVQDAEGSWKIDLTKPLPSPLILEHSTRDDVTTAESRPDWNEVLITMFDTSCDPNANGREDGVLPIFPGYGKFASTCPTDGIIDLEQTHALHSTSQILLPQSIDHYSGLPPKEMFWFEFIDGTSTSFWPTETQVAMDESYFDPTFASCACIECPSASPSVTPTRLPTSPPTRLPTSTPTVQPTVTPTASATLRNTREETKGCPPATYEICNAFAGTFCTSSGQGEFSYGDMCIFEFTAQFELRRKLRALEAIVLSVEMEGRDGFVLEHLQDAFDTIEILSTGELKRWAETEMQYHSGQYRTQMNNVE